jgi:hypothetical protein
MIIVLAGMISIKGPLQGGFSFADFLSPRSFKWSKLGLRPASAS